MRDSELALSISRMGVLGIKAYPTETQMVSAIEQASQYTGQYCFATNSRTFWRKSERSTAHINDYEKIADFTIPAGLRRFNGITLNAGTVPPTLTDPTGQALGHFYVNIDTGTLYFRDSDSWITPNSPSHLLNKFEAEYFYDSETMFYDATSTDIFKTLDKDYGKNIAELDKVKVSLGFDADKNLTNASISRGEIIRVDRTIFSKEISTSGDINSTSPLTPDKLIEITDFYKKFPRWRPNGSYYLNSIVQHNRQIYLNISGQAGNALWEAPDVDTDNWKNITISSGSWIDFDRYKKPTVVGAQLLDSDGNGKDAYYIATTSSSARPWENPQDYMRVSEEGVAMQRFLNRDFVVNDIIQHRGIIYRNVTGNHLYPVGPDVDKVNWIKLDNILAPIYNPSKVYKLGDVVVKSDPDTKEAGLYIKSPLPLGETGSNWEKFVETNGVEDSLAKFRTGVTYAIGDAVTYEGAIYYNKTGYVTSSTPNNDEVNWKALSVPDTVWDSTRTYNQGAVVTYNGVTYTNITGLNRTNPASDDNDDWLEAGSQLKVIIHASDTAMLTWLRNNPLLPAHQQGSITFDTDKTKVSGTYNLGLIKNDGTARVSLSFTIADTQNLSYDAVAALIVTQLRANGITATYNSTQNVITYSTVNSTIAEIVVDAKTGDFDGLGTIHTFNNIPKQVDSDYEIENYIHIVEDTNSKWKYNKRINKDIPFMMINHKYVAASTSLENLNTNFPARFYKQNDYALVIDELVDATDSIYGYQHEYFSDGVNWIKSALDSEKVLQYSITTHQTSLLNNSWSTDPAITSKAIGSTVHVLSPMYQKVHVENWNPTKSSGHEWRKNNTDTAGNNSMYRRRINILPGDVWWPILTIKEYPTTTENRLSQIFNINHEPEHNTSFMARPEIFSGQHLSNDSEALKTIQVQKYQEIELRKTQTPDSEVYLQYWNMPGYRWKLTASSTETKNWERAKSRNAWEASRDGFKGSDIITSAKSEVTYSATSKIITKKFSNTNLNRITNPDSEIIVISRGTNGLEASMTNFTNRVSNLSAIFEKDKNSSLHMYYAGNNTVNHTINDMDTQRDYLDIFFYHPVKISRFKFIPGGYNSGYTMFAKRLDITITYEDGSTEGVDWIHPRYAATELSGENSASSFENNKWLVTAVITPKYPNGVSGIVSIKIKPVRIVRGWAIGSFEIEQLESRIVKYDTRFKDANNTKQYVRYHSWDEYYDRIQYKAVRGKRQTNVVKSHITQYTQNGPLYCGMLNYDWDKYPMYDLEYPSNWIPSSTRKADGTFVDPNPSITIVQTKMDGTPNGEPFWFFGLKGQFIQRDYPDIDYGYKTRGGHPNKIRVECFRSIGIDDKDPKEVFELSLTDDYIRAVSNVPLYRSDYFYKNIQYLDIFNRNFAVNTEKQLLGKVAFDSIPYDMYGVYKKGIYADKVVVTFMDWQPTSFRGKTSSKGTIYNSSNAVEFKDPHTLSKNTFNYSGTYTNYNTGVHNQRYSADFAGAWDTPLTRVSLSGTISVSDAWFNIKTNTQAYEYVGGPGDIFNYNKDYSWVTTPSKHYGTNDFVDVIITFNGLVKLAGVTVENRKHGKYGHYYSHYGVATGTDAKNVEVDPVGFRYCNVEFFDSVDSTTPISSYLATEGSPGEVGQILRAYIEPENRTAYWVAKIKFTLKEKRERAHQWDDQPGGFGNIGFLFAEEIYDSENLSADWHRENFGMCYFSPILSSKDANTVGTGTIRNEQWIRVGKGNALTNDGSLADGSSWVRTYSALEDEGNEFTETWTRVLNYRTKDYSDKRMEILPPQNAYSPHGNRIRIVDDEVTKQFKQAGLEYGKTFKV